MNYEMEEECMSFGKIEVTIGDINYGIISDAIVNKIDKRIMESLREKIEEKIISKIEELSEKMIQDYIQKFVSDNLTIEVPQYDQFGKNTGNSKTPLDIILDKAKLYLEEKVDYSGKICTSSCGDTITRLKYLTKDMIERKFEVEITNATSKMKKEIGDNLKANAVKWLNEFKATVTKAIGGVILNPPS